MSLIGFKAKNHQQQTAARGALDEVDDRGTKWEFIRVLEERMGAPFTLDVAAAPHNAKAETYFTRADDGLTKHWTGRVWCNPPYSRVRNTLCALHAADPEADPDDACDCSEARDLGSWVRKAWSEWRGGGDLPTDVWSFVYSSGRLHSHRGSKTSARGRASHVHNSRPVLRPLPVKAEATSADGPRTLDDLLAERLYSALLRRSGPPSWRPSRPHRSVDVGVWAEVPEARRAQIRAVVADLRTAGYLVVPYPPDVVTRPGTQADDATEWDAEARAASGIDDPPVKEVTLPSDLGAC